LKHMFDQGYTLADLKHPTKEVYDEMVRYIKEDVDFFGVSGQININGDDLPGILGVEQIQGGQKVLVQTIDLVGVAESIVDNDGNPRALVWGDGSTAPGSSFSPCADGTVRTPAGNCEACSVGKYHDVHLKDCIPCDAGYVNAEEGKVGRGACVGCREGTFAAEIGSASCDLCDAGKFAAASGSITCQECEPGQYQGESGSRECERCEQGFYMPNAGASACHECPNKRTTVFLSALEKLDCVCPENFYEPTLEGREQDFSCEACGEGMTCALGSTVGNWNEWRSGDKTGTEPPYPKLETSFYSVADDPVYVYRCLDATDCPGGDPGVCRRAAVASRAGAAT